MFTERVERRLAAILAEARLRFTFVVAILYIRIGGRARSFVLPMVGATASSVLIAPAWLYGPANGVLYRGGARCRLPPPQSRVRPRSRLPRSIFLNRRSDVDEEVVTAFGASPIPPPFFEAKPMPDCQGGLRAREHDRPEDVRDR